MVKGSAIDLDLIARAGLVTSRYAGFELRYGVPVRISIGEPRFWRLGPLEFVRELCPWERASWDRPTEPERRAVYEQRLERHADPVVARLAQIARVHGGGHQLVLLCFEDVWAGQECHRRWFAEWFEARYGVVVPELGLSLQERDELDEQLRLF